MPTFQRPIYVAAVIVLSPGVEIHPSGILSSTSGGSPASAREKPWTTAMASLAVGCILTLRHLSLVHCCAEITSEPPFYVATFAEWIPVKGGGPPVDDFEKRIPGAGVRKNSPVFIANYLAITPPLCRSRIPSRKLKWTQVMESGTCDLLP